jgi:hypothetical protein
MAGVVGAVLCLSEENTEKKGDTQQLKNVTHSSCMTDLHDPLIYIFSWLSSPNTHRRLHENV